MIICDAHLEQIKAGLTKRVGEGYKPRLLECVLFDFKAKSLERVGLEMVSCELCPLCDAYLHGGWDEEWIRGCLDAEAEAYKRKEFLSRVNPCAPA